MNRRLARDPLDLADHPLRGLVGRMRLAGEQEQHRPTVDPHELLEPAQIRHQQRRALVGREPPREADREHVGVGRIDELQQPMDVRLAQAVALVLALEPLAHDAQHLALDLLVRPPELLVGNVEDLRHQLAVHDAVAPVGRKMLVEQRGPGGAQKGRRVHAIGHIADRVLVRRHVGPGRRAEPRRHASVDLADAIHRRRAAAARATSC